MDKEIIENFFSNVEWFNNFFSDIGEIFNTFKQKIKKEFGLEKELQYYQKSMYQPSIPNYYCLLMGGKFSIQIFVNLTKELIENHPHFVNEPSIIVIKHHHPRYDWVDELGLKVITNQSTEELGYEEKIFKGKIKFKNTEETVPFSAFQVSLEHFKKGVNLEEIIEDVVIRKIKEIEDSETR